MSEFNSSSHAQTNSVYGTPGDLDPALREAIAKLKRLSVLRPKIAAAVIAELVDRANAHHGHHHQHHIHDPALVQGAWELDLVAWKLICSDQTKLSPEVSGMLHECRYLHPAIIEVVNGYDDGAGDEDTDTDGEKGLADLLPHPNRHPAETLVET